jgi:hypothetical protein
MTRAILVLALGGLLGALVGYCSATEYHAGLLLTDRVAVLAHAR